jgi:HEAT repeat protein
MHCRLLFACLVLAAPVGRADEPTFNDRPLSAWLTMLKEDPTPRKRRAAVVALGQIAATDKAEFATSIAAVGRAMVNDAVPAVRQQAATVIGQQKVEDALVVLTDLTTAVRVEKEPSVRREVAVTLGRFGKLAKQAVPALIEALADKDDGVKAATAEALGRVGPEARAAAPELLKLAKGTDKPLRLAATFALGRIDADDKLSVAAALVETLKAATEVELRREAITSLGLLGESRGGVLPALAAQLADRDAEHRVLTIDAIGKLGPAVRSVESELLGLFQTDPDKGVRQVSIRTLCKGLNPEAVRLIPVLTQRLQTDADFEVRVAIAQELGGLGVSGKGAIPALRAAQRDPQIRVREAAAAAIKQIDRAGAKAASEPPNP